MSNYTPGTLASLFRMSEEELEKHSRLIFWEGVLFVVFGFFAIILPPLASLVVTMVVGWLFLISGFLEVFRGWKARRTSVAIWNGVIGAVSVVAGLLLLFEPLRGVVTLTFLVAIYFLVTGVFKLFIPFQMSGIPNRWWVFADGVVTILLAIFILAEWPYSGLWFLGVLAGIYLLFGGNSLIFLSIGLKRARKEHLAAGGGVDKSHPAE